MAYNQRDVFPKALPPKFIQFSAIVEQADPSVDIPVTYAFGTAAPTTININSRTSKGAISREVLGATSQGPFGPKGTQAVAQGRMFIEFQPYSWYP